MSDHPDDLKTKLAEVEDDLALALRELKACLDEKDGILKRSHRGGNASLPLEVIYSARASIRMIESNQAAREQRAVEWRTWREKNGR